MQKNQTNKTSNYHFITTKYQVAANKKMNYPVNFYVVGITNTAVARRDSEFTKRSSAKSNS